MFCNLSVLIQWVLFSSKHGVHEATLSLLPWFLSCNAYVPCHLLFALQYLSPILLSTAYMKVFYLLIIMILNCKNGWCSVTMLAMIYRFPDYIVDWWPFVCRLGSGWQLCWSFAWCLVHWCHCWGTQHCPVATFSPSSYCSWQRRQQGGLWSPLSCHHCWACW